MPKLDWKLNFGGPNHQNRGWGGPGLTLSGYSAVGFLPAPLLDRTSFVKSQDAESPTMRNIHAFSLLVSADPNVIPDDPPSPRGNDVDPPTAQLPKAAPPLHWRRGESLGGRFLGNGTGSCEMPWLYQAFALEMKRYLSYSFLSNRTGTLPPKPAPRHHTTLSHGTLFTFDSLTPQQ